MNWFGLKAKKKVEPAGREDKPAAQKPLLYEDYACDLPAHYYIEPTNLCNLRCVFCATGNGENKYPKGTMSLVNYQIILNKIAPHTKNISLLNMGEPFLNYDLVKMVKMTAERRIETVVASNLSLPDLDHEAIVRSGLTALIVGIEGTDQESYGKYRVGGDFQLVIDNIKKLQAVKARLNVKSPVIYWRFLLHKYNEHLRNKAKQLAKELGVEYEQYLLMVNNDVSWETAFHKIRNHELALFKYSEPEQYAVRQRALPLPIENIVLHPLIPGLCSQPFDHMFIGWDGQAVPCCATYDRSGALGSLLDTDISELWNNRHYRECRRFLYNYGPRQNSGSVCANLRCELAQKYKRPKRC